jgi:hypothetical protein
MARDTDRKCVSEAVRKQASWVMADITPTWVQYVRREPGGLPNKTRVLSINFGNAGQVRSAQAWTLTEKGQWIDVEKISAHKRERVLTIIEGTT